MSRPSQRSRPESVYSASGSSFISPASAVPSTPPTSVGGGDGLAETRKRQSRRDEAIRKKIESELARKRPPSKRSGTSGGTSHRAPKPKQGTVSALRPLPALTVPAAMSVADASQLCAAKRTDCVLVVDENEHLCGIFTAKDLAFRVVGDGLDPRSTPVSAIMTPNPMVTRDTTSATEALQTMVTRGFRHLPVCNEDGDVVGLLDITKVFHESLEKLEKAYGSSQRLYSALEGAQEQFGAVDTGAANPLLAYVQALRDKMSFPDLGSILDARTTAATVGVKTSVREAAKLMREKRTTAVVVVEGDGKKIAGIFTSKDVVLRVIAAGLDSKTCSVVRVMTPHPDVALPSLSIQDALRKMNDGHYLNLPVVDEAGALIGIVDVLKLTYATLEQVNSLHVEGGADAAGGPLWGRFFSAAAQAAGDDDDTESMVSGVNGSEAASSQAPPFQTPTRPGYHRSKDSIDTPGSELYPNDSASVIHDDGASDLAPAPRRPGQASSVGGASSQAVPIVDDGTYLFKFVAPGGTTHRFQARYDSHEFLLDIVSGKLSSDPFFAEQSEDEALPKADPKDFSISYRDDDGDLVLMTADRDVTDAVQTAKQQGKDRVVLHVSGGQSWKAALAAKEDAAAAAPAVATTKKLVVVEEGDEERIEEEQDVTAEPVKRKSSKKAAAGDDLVGGVLPKEYLLPASIGFLGVVIAGVFIASRASASSR
ncbi:hypothetical protein NBRC10513v2_002734 [Rhodotorula toruloides]|uniref:CBS and PB1 domain containing protein n=1 Tax=Rhodotorula toruloides TaxID=5286 RepID=A0A2T0AA27_RHOTO|nr:hypothetical protein AAT19DRAFT_13880 [Rhodotorula toruloides]